MLDPNQIATASSGTAGSSAARAVVVNRTHRIVRERAELLRSRQTRSRSLLAPMVISAAISLITALAIWSLLNQYAESYDRASTGIPDASNQFLVMLLWFLPVTTALIALTLFRRAQADREKPR